MSMHFGYTILYVPDVEAALSFYERAFGFQRKFLHESGTYGELATGDTILGFAAEAMAESNGADIEPMRMQKRPAGFEICFVTPTPESAFAHAIACGAMAVHDVVTKPWGQRVGHVRDLNGCLVELCTPVNG